MGLFNLNKSKTGTTIQWKNIESIEELNESIETTLIVPAVYFLHSTRCPISRMALHKFESEWNAQSDCSLFYIDLLSFRQVSDEISKISGVVHQSPQVIVIKDKKTIYDASHSAISAEKIINLL